MVSRCLIPLILLDYEADAIRTFLYANVEISFQVDLNLRNHSRLTLCISTLLCASVTPLGLGTLFILFALYLDVSL